MRKEDAMSTEDNKAQTGQCKSTRVLPIRKEMTMSGWGYDPMGDAIRAERERQVASYQMERRTRAAMTVRSQETGGPEQSRSLSQLWHYLSHRLHTARENRGP
jgi:hypothetical protein